MRQLHRAISFPLLSATLVSGTLPLGAVPTLAQANPADEVVNCEIMIVGGGLAGTAAAYESLLAGRTVCMTDITDWVGGQLSSQGTTALDELSKQRALAFYARGYNEMRARVEAKYGRLNPGECWVSVSCFLPKDANTILMEMLVDAARKGGGELKWFPNTVVKDLSLNAAGNQITSLTAIQHSPAPGAEPLNTEPLSATIEDAYTYDDSPQFSKTVIQFVPVEPQAGGSAAVARPADWYVVEATETGEIIGLADLPYQLGLDPRSYLNPSSPVRERDPYCTQGFTYPFAMERTETVQTYDLPDYYSTYEPIYGFDPRPTNAQVQDAESYFDFVFTYRRIWNAKPARQDTIFGVPRPGVGDISMQNWGPGNDYNPGSSLDNLIYSRDQLEANGQLSPGGWMGGLRTDTLRKGEENAIGFFYWLATSDTNKSLFADDPVFGDGIKDPYPYLLYLEGLDSPMGTAHGLSKYPYIREARRIIGRPFPGYEAGFSLNEVDVVRKEEAFTEDPYYQQALSPEEYLRLRRELAGPGATAALIDETPAEEIPFRTRARIFPDSVGISQYTIDFHPCYGEYPVEAVNNYEREGVRQGHGPAYPGQIPLRAMIPQDIDNMLVAGKGIAMSYIVAAGYRVHSFEWSVGAAAAQTLDFSLDNGVIPYDLVDNLPSREPLLEQLQQEMEADGNPVMFPDTSIFNEDWEGW